MLCPFTRVPYLTLFTSVPGLIFQQNSHPGPAHQGSEPDPAPDFLACKIGALQQNWCPAPSPGFIFYLLSASGASLPLLSPLVVSGLFSWGVPGVFLLSPIWSVVPFPFARTRD